MTGREAQGQWRSPPAGRGMRRGAGRLVLLLPGARGWGAAVCSHVQVEG